MKNKIVVAILFVIIILLVGCFQKNQEVTSGKSVKKIEQLSVASGEIMDVQDNVIISKKGITINGNINLQGKAKEGFEIIAETGDIVISGSVSVDGNNQEVKLKGIESDGASNFISGLVNGLLPSVNAEVEPEINLDGSITFTARQGSIEIHPSSVIKALDGKNAEDLIVRSLLSEKPEGSNADPVAKETADAGKEGGSIIFDALLVKLILSTNILKNPTFRFGNGGNGGNVVIEDAEGFPDELTPQMEYIGGRGGFSGRLILKGTTKLHYYVQSEQNGNIDGPFDLHADIIEPVLGKSLLNAVRVFGGAGGKGGNVEWIIDEDRRYKNVDFIDLIGGDGGLGMALGGRGGSAKFLSDKAFNYEERVPREATHVTVKGGNGGDVYFSYLPVAASVGGSGGLAVAQGNNGFDGYDGFDNLNEDSTLNGARGGDISIYYGDGGSIVAPVTDLMIGYPYNIISSDDLMSIFLQGSSGGDGAPQLGPVEINKAGDGGIGGDGCGSEGPGGNGGNGGDVIEIIAGNGGSGYFGGNGGNLYEVILGIGENGGQGTSPGKAGKTGAVLHSSTGAGGRGLIENGVAGEEFEEFSSPTNKGYIAVDGQTCKGGEVAKKITDECDTSWKFEKMTITTVPENIAGCSAQEGSRTDTLIRTWDCKSKVHKRIERAEPMIPGNFLRVRETRYDSARGCVFRGSVFEDEPLGDEVLTFDLQKCINDASGNLQLVKNCNKEHFNACGDYFPPPQVGRCPSFTTKSSSTCAAVTIKETNRLVFNGQLEPCPGEQSES
jgi:hypothetical protein